MWPPMPPMRPMPLTGLSAGDRVLRSPGSTLVDGQAVEMAALSAASAASAATPSSAAVSAPR